MSGNSFVWVVAGSAAVTYLTRFPAIVLGRRLSLSPRWRRGLSYAPIGVLSGLVAPSVIWHHAASGPLWPFYGAVAAAFIAASLTRSPLWAMVAGVVADAVLQHL